MMELLAQGAKWLGINLSAAQLEQFEAYYRALADAKVDLTAVRGYEEVQRRHFLEPLTLLVALYRLGVLARGTSAQLLDLGAGGGFPGLPMALAAPSLRVTLLEATGKKAEFLRDLVVELGPSAVAVVAARAETAAHATEHREGYDVVVARAVAPLPTLVELALPFVRLGGWLAALKGSKAHDEVKAAEVALAVCGGEVTALESLDVPGASIAPTLVLVRKVASTPEAYPRRSGIPAKRPLR